MTILDAFIARGVPVPALRPWPRVAIDVEAWRDAIAALAAGEIRLASEWGEADTVHMAIAADGDPRVAVLTLACPERRFPSVGASHAPAIRLERAIRDLFGLTPDGLPDGRAWLEHRRWGVVEHLGRVVPAPSPVPAAGTYPFLAAEGENLHQIPVGPVHAGIIEPGHFRFTASGEAIVRLEERLGYVHKGIDGLMAGADIATAARLAGRTSGDSTVAYAFAFARAVEAALGVEAPPRAVWLRALMAELERLANHFGDIGAICNDASFALMQAHCAALRERVLRLAALAFGHRLMMDAVVPGGVAADLSPDATAALRALPAEIRNVFPRLVNLYDSTTSLQDRTVGTGMLTPELAARFAPGGFIGRASGRAFDARRSLPYAPYDELRFDVPVRADGDVNARVWIRIEEVEQSLGLIEQIAAGLPPGAIRAELPRLPGEGIAIVEGFRGDVLASVRLGTDGLVERCHLRDPSWFQWPLLEAVIEGNIVADFPLCNKSFNCSYSGHDL
ncbi:NADH-quinone oxidoreductase subunit C [soil metagenome]